MRSDTLQNKAQNYTPHHANEMDQNDSFGEIDEGDEIDDEKLD